MFKFDILDVSDDLTIDKVGDKSYPEMGGMLLSKWVRNIKVDGGKELPNVSSSLNVKKEGKTKGCDNSIGYMLFNSNTPSESVRKVTLFSTPYVHGQGLNINNKNFEKVIIGFSGRKLTILDWLNDKDEYIAPDEEHEQFEHFKYDSLVYSLFNNSSEQSSLRQIEYKDKLWDIKNEFFWVSADRMKELADENGYDELYNDARTASDRHVYKLLFGEERIYDKLSDDAKVVLDKATEMVENSIQMRKMMANDENHLNSWDAGYAQLKLVWKEYFPEDFKEFRELYKSLENRMRPLVYELGFLMK